MFTQISTALMLAALGLTAGLTGSAQAASQARACDASPVLLAQYIPPVIPQLPTFPQQPSLLVPLPPIQPSLKPALPICPAPLPRPQIVQPAARCVAVTGDDDGCTTPHGKGHISVPPPIVSHTLATLPPGNPNPADWLPGPNPRLKGMHLPGPPAIAPQTTLAVTGDDNGCVPPHGNKPSHPTPSGTTSA